jgi:hypothetical protein
MGGAIAGSDTVAKMPRAVFQKITHFQAIRGL